MDIRAYLRRPKIYLFLAIILTLATAYLILHFLMPGQNPLSQSIAFITHPVILLIEKITNAILHWEKSAMTISNHGIMLNGALQEGFTTKIMFKKVILFYIIVLWLTKASKRNKVLFTILYLVLGFLSSIAYNVAGAYQLVSNIDFLSYTYTVVFLCLNTILLIWYLMNRRTWLKGGSERSGFKSLLIIKLPDIIKVMYIYAIIYFSLSIFQFSILIDIILGSAQKIAQLLGYDSVIEGNILIGNNGSISLYRTCLGIITMFFFAAIVYLTGNEKKKGWGFIITGLLILVITNIIRILLVFIHLQKHGDYMLTVEVHDLYNYVTYTIVFILWVIWFEKILNIRKNTDRVKK